MTATKWPRLKRGNPYRHAYTFGFTSGSITDCEAVLMIKDDLSDTDASALLVAVSDPASPLIDELGAIVALTLEAGAAPNTGVITIDLPASATALLDAGRPFIGLQLELPNGEPIEFGCDLLEKQILVESDVVRRIPATP